MKSISMNALLSLATTAVFALIYHKAIDVNAKMVSNFKKFTTQTCIRKSHSINLPCTGYSGINCQEEKSDCRNDTCPQRAMCKDEPGVGNFTCLCRSGYTGENCDLTVITRNFSQLKTTMRYASFVFG